MGQPEDAELIDRFLQGDERAFDALYARYRKNLLGYAFSLLRNTHDAQEALQSAWLGWLGRLDSLNGPTNFRAYLYRSVRNAAFDIMRSASRKPPEPVRWIKPKDSLVQAEQAEAVQQAVENLPDDQQETVVLRMMEGMEFREIAGITDTPEKTVRSRWRLAMEKLKLTLESYK